MTEEPLKVEPYTGPALVYGLWRENGFVVVGAAWAAKAADEIEAIVEARTWNQAKEASDSARHVYGPISDDLEDFGFAPDDPVVVDEIPGWADGDWPPMVCLYTEEYLPSDWPLGEVFSTMLNGDGVVIPHEHEPRLLEIAQRAGAPLSRDDSLISRLDPQW